MVGDGLGRKQSSRFEPRVHQYPDGEPGWQGQEMETRQKLKNYEIHEGGGGEKHERLLMATEPPSLLRAILDSAASLRRVLIDGTPAVFTESQRDWMLSVEKASNKTGEIQANERNWAESVRSQ